LMAVDPCQTGGGAGCACAEEQIQLKEAPCMETARN
jgi:hypothetical protein